MNLRSLKSICMVAAATALLVAAGGCKKQPPIKLACNAMPPAIYPGEPVTVTAAATDVSTKKNNNVIYSWSGAGVTGEGSSATVATEALPPGSHSVSVSVKEGKRGREGRKEGQSADCTANFTVKQFEPPAISCAADPTTLKPGDSSTITATAESPQNRPLTYSYSASAGSISGSGSTATYSSEGAPTGTVQINCNVSDDKDHSVSAETSVTIEAPPPPPTPHVEPLCSVSFADDARRPTRVNNEAKACLDSIALTMQQQPDAKLVVVGDATAQENEKTAKQEKYAARHRRATVIHYAAQRAVNVKEYLVTDKGIDPSRISASIGSSDDQTVQNYLVPEGADFTADVQGTTPVDESQYTPQQRKPLPMRHHHKMAPPK
jgi:outer membrane protein OmpA-like peptidoglycan-associated protein